MARALAHPAGRLNPTARCRTGPLRHHMRRRHAGMEPDIEDVGARVGEEGIATVIGQGEKLDVFPDCPRCDQDMRIIAFVIESASVQRILDYIGEPSNSPSYMMLNQSEIFSDGALRPGVRRMSAPSDPPSWDAGLPCPAWLASSLPVTAIGRKYRIEACQVARCLPNQIGLPVIKLAAQSHFLAPRTMRGIPGRLERQS